MINKIIEDLEVEIQNSSSTYESKKLKYKLKFLKRASLERPEYEYSKVEYKGATTKISLYCKEHGNFEITPQGLFKGGRCPICTERDRRLKSTKSNDTFIKQVQEVSPEYDYVKVSYKNCKEKVEVICKEHGSFFIRPSELLKGCGCIKCYDERRGESLKLTYDKFKEKLLEQDKGHLSIKDKDYKGSNSPLVFTCSIHGVQHINKAYNLLVSRYGCPKCGKHIRSLKGIVPLEEVKKRLYNKFGDKVSIVDSSYISNTTEATFMCQEHGEYINKVTNVIGNKYPCKKCADKYGDKDKDYYDKPTTLYYIKLIKGNEEYFKLGITTQTMSERFRKTPQENVTYQIIATKTFPTGSIAYYLEQYLLHQHSTNRIDFILLPKSGGNSEIFNQDIYESIKQYFD